MISATLLWWFLVGIGDYKIELVGPYQSKRICNLVRTELLLALEERRNFTPFDYNSKISFVGTCNQEDDETISRINGRVPPPNWWFLSSGSTYPFIYGTDWIGPYVSKDACECSKMQPFDAIEMGPCVPKSASWMPTQDHKRCFNATTPYLCNELPRKPSLGICIRR